MSIDAQWAIHYVLNYDKYPVEAQIVRERLLYLANASDGLENHKLRKFARRNVRRNRDVVQSIIEDMYGIKSGNYLAFAKEDDRAFLRLMAGYLGAHGLHRRKHFKKYLAFLGLKDRLTNAEVAALTGESEKWVEGFIDDVSRRGLAALKEDGRQANGKKASKVTPQIIAAVCEAIKKPSPDGFHWKGHHVQAYMMAELGMQAVSKTTAYEVLKKAKNINRKNSG